MKHSTKEEMAELNVVSIVNHLRGDKELLKYLGITNANERIVWTDSDIRYIEVGEQGAYIYLYDVDVSITQHEHKFSIKLEIRANSYNHLLVRVIIVGGSLERYIGHGPIKIGYHTDVYRYDYNTNKSDDLVKENLIIDCFFNFVGDSNSFKEFVCSDFIREGKV